MKMTNTHAAKFGRLIHLLLVIVLVGMTLDVTEAFTTTTTMPNSYRHQAYHVSTNNKHLQYSGQVPSGGAFFSPQASPVTASSSNVVLSSTPSPNVDGTGRGTVIQVIVLLVCVWIFSIPPEFRRAHMCMTEACEQNRAACYDCVTQSEWIDNIASYYKNGGGIQFDFTVGEETKQLFGSK